MMLAPDGHKVYVRDDFRAEDVPKNYLAQSSRKVTAPVLTL